MKTIIILFLITTNCFAMNKAELVEAMASNSGLSKADVKRALDGLDKTVNQLLPKQEDIRIPNLATLSCKAKERGNRVKCKSNLKLNRSTARSLSPVYIDNFFNTLISTMVSSSNHKQYVCSFNESGDCDDGDEDIKPSDYNSSRSNKIATIYRASSYGLEKCYKESNLYEEIFSERTIELAKQRCLKSFMTSLDMMIEEDPSLRIEKENLSNLINSGISSLFQKLSDYLDEDDDGDGILTAKVALYSGLSKADAKRALDGFSKSVIGALKKGDEVVDAGFGSFSISKRSARTGRNPQTGKEIKIAAKNIIKFKAGAELSKKVN